LVSRVQVFGSFDGSEVEEGGFELVESYEQRPTSDSIRARVLRAVEDHKL
jgi:hypothetical protein